MIILFHLACSRHSIFQHHNAVTAQSRYHTSVITSLNISQIDMQDKWFEFEAETTLLNTVHTPTPLFCEAISRASPHINALNSYQSMSHYPNIHTHSQTSGADAVRERGKKGTSLNKKRAHSHPGYWYQYSIPVPLPGNVYPAGITSSPKGPTGFPSKKKDT